MTRAGSCVCNLNINILLAVESGSVVESVRTQVPMKRLMSGHREGVLIQSAISKRTVSIGGEMVRFVEPTDSCLEREDVGTTV